MIHVESISKSYAGLLALVNFSLCAGAGARIGLLGPNGAGKSTAIKMIVGAMAPDEGSVAIGGLDALEYPFEVRRMVGWMPEAVPVYEEMEVQAYLRFCAGARNLAGKEIHAAIERVVALTQLESVFYRPIRELSRGFRQRVGLAQALVHDPKVLVLDEPTSGLDPIQVEVLHRCLLQLCNEEQKTLILSTHILSDVEALVQRVLMLRRGETIFDGTLAEARTLDGTEHSLREAFLVRMQQEKTGVAT